MVNVRLASDHQYGKLLFTWLSLVISLMVSFFLSFSHETSWMRYGTELSQFLRISHLLFHGKYVLVPADKVANNVVGLTVILHSYLKAGT